MNDIYKTISSNRVGEGFYSDKRSKFLAFAHHVNSTDSVKKLLQSYRRKFYDARHICYAYMLGADKADFKANDDGEPSSTAGKPILGQILSNDLTNILIVVVRYYGGVNLGTGGLIVAYRSAATDAINHCEVINEYVREQIKFSFPYVMMNGVMKIIKTMEADIVSQTYNNTCEMTLSIRSSKVTELKKRLDNLSFS